MLAKFVLWQYQKIDRYDTWMRQHFSFNGHWLLTLMVAAAVFGVDTQHSTTYQLFVFLLTAMLFSFLIKGLSRFNAHATRRLPRYGTVGEPLSYRVTLTHSNGKYHEQLTLIEQLVTPQPTAQDLRDFAAGQPPTRFSHWLSFKHWRNYLTYQRGGTIAPVALPRLTAEPLTVNITFTPTRRGKLHFDAGYLAQPDVLGLSRRLLKISEPASCLILPKRYPMKALALSGRHKYQAGGVSLANSVGNSQEFMALRDYQHGDPLNKIHWKSFAKHRTLIVKDYQDEYFVRRALLLDTFAQANERERFEAAVSVAASLAVNEQQNDALLDFMFVGDKTYCFTVGRSVDQLPHLHEILAQVQSQTIDSIIQLQQAVLARAGQCSSFACVFVRWDETRQQFVQTLRAHGLPVAVFVLHDGDLTAALCPNRPAFFYLLNTQNLAADLAAI